MPNEFVIEFKKENGNAFQLSLGLGQVIYVLGPNGSGKSSLVTHIFQNHFQHAKRISAHRQTWISANPAAPFMLNRGQLDFQILERDRNNEARYREELGDQRVARSLSDLIDANALHESEIARLVREKDISGASKLAEALPPVSVINEIFRLSNLQIQIAIEERQKVVVRRNEGKPYSVSELSDGERNALLLAADVLTATKGCLVIIDEPERHLHRSIISPLLTLLLSKRKDCAFIISTHEVMLPLDNPEAQTLLVRSWAFDDSKPVGWKTDYLPPHTDIDDELKRDILGSRQKIIFVEGEADKSLDSPLYSLLFPQVSVIAKGSCRNVEYAVKGLRAAVKLHWVQVWGIIDNDLRNEEQIKKLRDAGVFSLRQFTVESLYFHPKIVKFVSDSIAQKTCENGTDFYNRVIEAGLKGAAKSEALLIKKTVERLVRQRVAKELPSRAAIEEFPKISINIDVSAIRSQEEQVFKEYLDKKDFESLLQRYPLRSSDAFNAIACTLGRSKPEYEETVRTTLREDPMALEAMRELLGDLVQEVLSA